MKYEASWTVTQSEKKKHQHNTGKRLQRSCAVGRVRSQHSHACPRDRAKATALVCVVHELRYCSRDRLMLSLKLKKKPRTFNSTAKLRSSYHTEGISKLRSKYVLCVVVYELWKKIKQSKGKRRQQAEERDYRV